MSNLDGLFFASKYPRSHSPLTDSCPSADLTVGETFLEDQVPDLLAPFIDETEDPGEDSGLLFFLGKLCGGLPPGCIILESLETALLCLVAADGVDDGEPRDALDVGFQRRLISESPRPEVEQELEDRIGNDVFGGNSFHPESCRDNAADPL